MPHSEPRLFTRRKCPAIYQSWNRIIYYSSISGFLSLRLFASPPPPPSTLLKNGLILKKCTVPCIQLPLLRDIALTLIQFWAEIVHVGPRPSQISQFFSFVWMFHGKRPRRQSRLKTWLRSAHGLWANIGLRLAQRRRRWANIKAELAQRLVAGCAPQ